MVTEREYGGEIQERGLIPYRSKSPQKYQSNVRDAEFKVIKDKNDEFDDTEALTSEQISRMTPSEIEDFKVKRAIDFSRSLGISFEKAQIMVNAEVDPMIEGVKFERQKTEEQLARDKYYEDLQKQREQGKMVVQDEEVEEVVSEQKEEKPFEKIIEKVPSKDIVPKESIFEKMFGKRKLEVPKTEKEIRMERIQKSKEEHLAKIMKLRSKPVIGKMRGRGGYREPSLKDIGKGDMGTKEYEKPQSGSDFFGMNKYVMGTKSPKIGEKTIRVGLPSTKLKPVGIKPPSTSFGGGKDISQIVNIGFGSRSPPSVSIRPVTLKDKLEKQKFVKPAEFSLGFSNTIPDINASLSLGKYVSKKQISTSSKVKPIVVKPKNPVEDWGISNKVKNPMEDWGFTKKPVVSNKKEKLNNKKPKKESLDFLKMEI